MRSDDEITREMRDSFTECEPTADQLMAARARLEAHISQAAALESTGRRDRVVGRGETPVWRVASAIRGALKPGVKLAVPLIAGLVVLVLVAPASGVVSQAHQCSSVFGYGVPCGSCLSLAAGAATAVVVRLALWLDDRRRKHQK